METKRKTINEVNRDAGKNCSASLAKLSPGTHVEVKFVEPAICDIKDIAFIPDHRKLGVGVYLPIRGKVKGAGLLLFPIDFSLDLCDNIMKVPPRSMQELSEFDKDILKEVGNILLGSYLTTLTNSIEEEIIEGVPSLSSDMIGSILETFIIDFIKNYDETLVVKIELLLKKANIKGYMIIVLSSKVLESFF